MVRLPKKHLQLIRWELEGEDELPLLPETRGDCLPGGSNAERPCPFVSCRHHLYLDVDRRNGSVKLNFPDLDPTELPHSCALDVIDARGGSTLEAVGEMMNVTRERIRQIDEKVIAKVAKAVRTGAGGNELRAFDGHEGLGDGGGPLAEVMSSHGGGPGRTDVSVRGGGLAVSL
jgi:hypothetical protein